MNITLRLLLWSQADYAFPESQLSQCCTECKQKYPNAPNLCVNWISGSPSSKLQWFMTLNSGISWNDNTANDPNNGVFPSSNTQNKKYSTPCRECPRAWYREPASPFFCTCTRCSTTACPPGQYESVSCTTTTNKACSPCGSCGLGQETASVCGGTSNIVCRGCPAGTYRDQAVVNTQLTCKQCLTCSTSLRQKRAGCTATSGETCPACDTGQIVALGTSTDSCQACGAGTYARASDNTCATCTTCERTHQMTKDCAADGDRTCTACTQFTRARNKNSQVCDGCVQSYFRTGASSCAECARSSCGWGNYRECTYKDDYGGDQKCSACQGQKESSGTDICPAGKGVSTRCNGENTAAVACAECAAGTERAAGTALVGDIQKCMPCNTGYYKAAAGTSACTACSNKPASNTQYISWGTATPSTTGCPWICNAGFLRVGDTCQACAAGKYSTTAGATACQACTNAIANTYYLERTTTIASANDCPWECNAGYTRSGSTCTSCTAGENYRSAGQNVRKEGESNRCYECGTCILQNRPSTIGTYMTQECTPTSDRVCSTCRVACASGQYIQAGCNTTDDMQCQPCATVCPAGKYRSSVACTGQEWEDVQLANCRPCLTSCAPGQFLSGVCAPDKTTDKTCLPCSTNLMCSINEYAGGCGNSTDTRCLPFTTCNAGYYLADEASTRDGTCRTCSTCEGQSVVRPCTKWDDTVCRGSSSCGERAKCSRLTSTNRSALFCDYSLGPSEAFCGVCPPGYGSDGQYCTECPRGYTCDRVGQPTCRGQCGPGYRSECVSEYGLDYARCETKCVLPPETRRPWRGSFALADDENCATYFLCTPGFYKNFSSGGSISCDECNRALLPEGGVWVTAGLSVEDDASCLWECNHGTYTPTANGLSCELRPGRSQGYKINPAGSWTGQNGGGVCGMGKTSQEGTAIAPEECLACQPLVGDVMRWKDRTDQCEFECVRPSDTKRGSRCVPERRACSGEGLLLLGDLSCVPQTFPWNYPGYLKTGWGSPRVERFTPGAVLAQYPRAKSAWFGIKNRHTVTPNLGAAERQIEGQLCSNTTGWVGGHQYVFAALCNQSFLVYLNLSSSSKGLGVLIGNGTRGWRDGFKTQALFESELYVAGTGGGTLFVLDRWNCLLREVVVWDRPGSYLTRVHTLWGNTDKLALAVPEAKCYGAGSLAWPRRFFGLQAGSQPYQGWLAFGDEDGLWQFNTETRELLAMVKEETGRFEVDSLFALDLLDPHTLILGFQDGTVWVVEAEQAACPRDTTSLAGGGCTQECRWRDSAGRPSQYVDPATGACRACTSPVCGRGEALKACTPTADARCVRCEIAPNKTYTIAGTCDQGARMPTPPCQAGWYLVGSGQYCEACPAFTATRFAGAVRREQCKCLDGMVRRAGEGCVADGLYDRFDTTTCVAGTCRIPRNAQAALDDAVPCGWACNSGFYRDTLAGFVDQCRPCLAGVGRTRGDDDEPWSCE